MPDNLLATLTIKTNEKRKPFFSGMSRRRGGRYFLPLV